MRRPRTSEQRHQVEQPGITIDIGRATDALHAWSARYAHIPSPAITDGIRTAARGPHRSNPADVAQALMTMEQTSMVSTALFEEAIRACAPTWSEPAYAGLSDAIIARIIGIPNAIGHATWAAGRGLNISKSTALSLRAATGDDRIWTAAAARGLVTDDEHLANHLPDAWAIWSWRSQLPGGQIAHVLPQHLLRPPFKCPDPEKHLQRIADWCAQARSSAPSTMEAIGAALLASPDRNTAVCHESLISFAGAAATRILVHDAGTELTHIAVQIAKHPERLTSVWESGLFRVKGSMRDERMALIATMAAMHPEHRAAMHADWLQSVQEHGMQDHTVISGAAILGPDAIKDDLVRYIQSHPDSTVVIPPAICRYVQAHIGAPATARHLLRNATIGQEFYDVRDPLGLALRQEILAGWHDPDGRLANAAAEWSQRSDAPPEMAAISWVTSSASTCIPITSSQAALLDYRPMARQIAATVMDPEARTAIASGCLRMTMDEHTDQRRRERATMMLAALSHMQH